MSLGLGVMINMLSGNESDVTIYQNAIGKKIKSIVVNQFDNLIIMFEDETGIIFQDAGQSCCESRYMVCDDNLEYFVGATFMEATVEDAPNLEGSEEHEVQFLHIKTSKGSFTVSNHNEHNGYYGGFSIRVREV